MDELKQKIGILTKEVMELKQIVIELAQHIPGVNYGPITKIMVDENGKQTSELVYGFRK